MSIFKSIKTQPISGAEEDKKSTSVVTITPSSKIDLAKFLLCRSEGASLKELTDATGWLPHTMRAALTGLRKKGHAIERFSSDGTTLWRIPGTSPAREAPGNDDNTSNTDNITSPDASAKDISA
jgi:hypothetical protein